MTQSTAWTPPTPPSKRNCRRRILDGKPSAESAEGDVYLFATQASGHANSPHLASPVTPLPIPHKRESRLGACLHINPRPIFTTPSTLPTTVPFDLGQLPRVGSHATEVTSASVGMVKTVSMSVAAGNKDSQHTSVYNLDAGSHASSNSGKSSYCSSGRSSGEEQRPLPRAHSDAAQGGVPAEQECMLSTTCAPSTPHCGMAELSGNPFASNKYRSSEVSIHCCASGSGLLSSSSGSNSMRCADWDTGCLHCTGCRGASSTHIPGGIGGSLCDVDGGIAAKTLSSPVSSPRCSTPRDVEKAPVRKVITHKNSQPPRNACLVPAPPLH